MVIHRAPESFCTWAKEESNNGVAYFVFSFQLGRGISKKSSPTRMGGGLVGLAQNRTCPIFHDSVPKEPNKRMSHMLPPP